MREKSSNDNYNADLTKENLIFADFMGGGDDGDAYRHNVSYVEGFAELFKADYDSYSEYFTSYEAYVNNMHLWSQETQRKKQSESDVWDFTIVKPLIEIITGEDMIMHTKLTEEQKKLKAMGIFVDVSMFTFSLVSGGESITVRTTVKALLSEFVTGTSMVGVTYYANSVDLSFGETMLLMMIVGALTGTATNKAFDFAEDGVDNFIYGLKNGDYDDVVDSRAIDNIEAWRTGGKITDKNFMKADEFDYQARRYYNERLMDDSDVYLISQNTGFSPSDVKKIKNHIMSDMIPFKDGSIRKFDPDIDQALAWKRLMEGDNIRESDIILLNHELEELLIMENTGISYEDAHKMANQKYNWEKAMEEFVDNDDLY